MPSLQRYKLQKGFSLIELLIVILIISIVYFLGFEGIEFDKKKVKALTPLNLKSAITSSSDFFADQSTLLCINKCHNCYLRSNISSGFEEYKGPIDLSNIKAYTIDREDTLVPIEYERYQDQKICLIMDFYSNGSSTQIILEGEENSYFLPAFFGQPQVFSSPQEAKDYWLKHNKSVSDSGDFY